MIVPGLKTDGIVQGLLALFQHALYHKSAQMEKLLLLKNNVMMATNLTGMAALLFALLKQNTSAKENHLFALLVEI